MLQHHADRLDLAERRREPIDPITEELTGLTIQSAYQIQLLNVARRVGAGQRVCGHKVGLTAKAMQAMFGIEEPDYGHLLDDMFIAERTVVARQRFIAPRIEIETAFILAKPLHGPGLTVADVIGAIDYVVPAFEIIDSRIKDWRIKLQDTIADNGSSAAVVLGGRPMRLTDVDLRRMPASLVVDGDVAESGNTGDVLGNPLSATAWLGNALGRHGVGMEAGHVVLPGACTRAVAASAGGSFQGVFDGLGDVQIEFA